MDDIIQLRVYLENTKPVIWRRLRVEARMTLFELHHIIQIAFGWKNYHAYEFSHYDFKFGQPLDEAMESETGVVIDSRDVTLESILVQPRENLKYEYDFGDSWQHRVVVERFLPKKTLAQYPYCMSGKYSSPPEDCGGIKAYYNLLKILKDKTHPEYKETLKWVGRSFIPAFFDQDKVNEELSKLDKYIEDWMGDRVF